MNTLGKLVVSQAILYQWEGKEVSKLVPILTFPDLTEVQARNMMRDVKGENAPHNHHLRGIWKPYPVFLNV